MEVEFKAKYPKTEIEINTMSPLTWAYVGDCVYELYIRTYLVEKSPKKPHYLHIEATKYVKAGAQAQILEKIKDNLTEEEKEIVRRTRNTQNYHLPKNANPADYAHATALEGLIGYLYLMGKEERLSQILEMCVDSI